MNNMVDEKTQTEFITNKLYVKHFHNFLSEKIGTLLTEDEDKRIDYTFLDDTYKGQLVAYDKGNVKQFVIYVDDSDGHRATIITKEDGVIIFKQVFKAQLKTYPYILTTDENNIIETYSL